MNGIQVKHMPLANEHEMIRQQPAPTQNDINDHLVTDAAALTELCCMRMLQQVVRDRTRHSTSSTRDEYISTMLRTPLEVHHLLPPAQARWLFARANIVQTSEGNEGHPETAAAAVHECGLHRLIWVVAPSMDTQETWRRSLMDIFEHVACALRVSISRQDGSFQSMRPTPRDLPSPATSAIGCVWGMSHPKQTGPQTLQVICSHVQRRLVTQDGRMEMPDTASKRAHALWHASFFRTRIREHPSPALEEEHPSHHPVTLDSVARAAHSVPVSSMVLGTSRLDAVPDAIHAHTQGLHVSRPFQLMPNEARDMVRILTNAIQQPAHHENGVLRTVLSLVFGRRMQWSPLLVGELCSDRRAVLHRSVFHRCMMTHVDRYYAWLAGVLQAHVACGTNLKTSPASGIVEIRTRLPVQSGAQTVADCVMDNKWKRVLHHPPPVAVATDLDREIQHHWASVVSDLAKHSEDVFLVRSERKEHSPRATETNGRDHMNNAAPPTTTDRVLDRHFMHEHMQRTQRMWDHINRISKGKRVYVLFSNWSTPPHTHARLGVPSVPPRSGEGSTHTTQHLVTSWWDHPMSVVRLAKRLSVCQAVTALCTGVGVPRWMKEGLLMRRGTPAQRAVVHMARWCRGLEEHLPDMEHALFGHGDSDKHAFVSKPRSLRAVLCALEERVWDTRRMQNDRRCYHVMERQYVSSGPLAQCALDAWKETWTGTCRRAEAERKDEVSLPASITESIPCDHVLTTQDKQWLFHAVGMTPMGDDMSPRSTFFIHRHDRPYVLPPSSMSSPLPGCTDGPCPVELQVLALHACTRQDPSSHAEFWSVLRHTAQSVWPCVRVVAHEDAQASVSWTTAHALRRAVQRSKAFEVFYAHTSLRALEMMMKMKMKHGGASQHAMDQLVRQAYEASCITHAHALRIMLEARFASSPDVLAPLEAHRNVITWSMDHGTFRPPPPVSEEPLRAVQRTTVYESPQPGSGAVVFDDELHEVVLGDWKVQPLPSGRHARVVRMTTASPSTHSIHN